MSSQTFDSANPLEVDLLVVGAGMAALTAAARANAGGARVVLVEKSPVVGGSAMYAGYVWTADSYARMREVNPGGDPDLARVVVDGLGPGLDWIRSLGVEVKPPVVVLGYGRGCETDLAACQAAVRRRHSRAGSSTAWRSSIRRTT
jgi:glycine/D-amino acid oxidase-like deaminating enzyme